jgi:hypothetical protein
MIRGLGAVTDLAICDDNVEEIVDKLDFIISPIFKIKIF